MDFVDRESELKRIRNDISSDTSELVIVYGRRRIGKSELVKQSLDKDAVYFQATESTPEMQIEDFFGSIKQIYPGIENVKRDWEAALEFLAERDAVVAIDEFPYLVESDSSVPSVFQRFWDSIEDSEMKLFLVGSSISVMENKVLSGGSPLHGRWTDRIDLRPLSFRNSIEFFPDYSANEKVKAWSVFGGTPHYLKSIDSERSFSENVSDLVLSEQGVFRDEPEFLLRSELSQPHRYMAIIKAIARGNTSRNEIAQDSGIESSSIGTYLSKLERLRLIKREVPVTEEPPRSRSGRYRIKEPLVKFWFRFVYGNEDRIGLTEEPFEEIVRPELSDYVSSYFEQLCLERLPELLDRDYQKIGRWWYQENEIDVVGLKDEGKLLGECKYTNSEVGLKLLRDLEEKEDKIRVEGPTEYVLFSKSGFTEKLEDEVERRDDITLFELEDIV